MKTIAQYEHMLQEARNLPEGQRKAALEALENSLTQDLFAMQAQFRGRAASAIQGMNKRTGKERAESEQHRLDDQQKKLEPFQNLRKQVADLIKQP